VERRVPALCERSLGTDRVDLFVHHAEEQVAPRLERAQTHSKAGCSNGGSNTSLCVSSGEETQVDRSIAAREPPLGATSSSLVASGRRGPYEASRAFELATSCLSATTEKVQSRLLRKRWRRRRAPSKCVSSDRSC
jgi:hypothetical protein